MSTRDLTNSAGPETERKRIKAILIMAEVPNQTQEEYDGVLALVEPLIKQAPGFVMHAAYPVEGGWRSIEVWESKADATGEDAAVQHIFLPLVNH
jgi:hypothetical protein